MSKRDEFETPAGVPYDGPSGIARDSVWLTNQDIPHNKDTTLLIESVKRRDNVKFQGGRTKAIMLSLKFAKFERELGLNATNRKTMNALFGNQCKDWVGQRIALFVLQDVGYPDGSTGPAVRIRAKRITQQPAAAQAAQSASDPIDQDFERAAIAQEQKP